MSRHCSKKWFAVLTLSAPLFAAPAQACVFGLPMLNPTTSCPSQMQASPTCPVQPDGRDADCLLHKRDLAQAAGAVGNMAAGGMNLAGGILRGLAEQAQRAGSAFGGF